MTSVSDEGKLVDSFDDDGHVLLEGGRLDHVLQNLEHPGVHLSVPLDLVPTLGYHRAEITVIIHPLKMNIRAMNSDLKPRTETKLF